MTATATILLGVAVLFAVVDWVAVARTWHPLEYVCKPAATIAFLGAAIALDPASDASRAWCCVALVLCLAGDVFLMLPRDAFVPGLAAFAVAQVSFTVSFARQDPTWARLVIAVVLVVPGVLLVARRPVGALLRSDDRTLARVVVVYVTLIGAMAVSAIAGGTAVGIVGALLFVTSDSLIAEQRFVTPRGWQPLAIIVTYHLALVGLVLGQLPA